jgi:hypothetical protein
MFPFAATPPDIPEVIKLVPLHYYLFLSTALFVIGIVGGTYVERRQPSLDRFLILPLRSQRAGLCVFRNGRGCCGGGCWFGNNCNDLQEYP